MEVTKSIVVTVSGDEVKDLSSALIKVVKSVRTPGFNNNSITAEEIAVLKSLSEKLEL